VWDLKTEQAAPQAPPVTPPAPQPEPAPQPKVVAPAPVEQPPAPKAPDIALERLKEQKQKQKLLDKKLAEEKVLREKQLKEKQKELAEAKAEELAEKKAKELADKKAKDKADKLAKAAAEAAEKKRNDKLFEADMKRLSSQAGGSGSAAQSTAPRIDKSYEAAIRTKIKHAVSYSDTDVPGNPEAVFSVEQLPTGEIISVVKKKSSGISAFDDAVERGIRSSSPLPKKKDGTVERSLIVGIKLKELD
jgi:colicin import membrane protein